MITGMIVSIVVLCIVLLISLYYNYRFGKIVLDVEDAIEESLDVLDERYRIISEISKKPVFFDSHEVRQVIDEIRKARDSILFVANSLSFRFESYENLQIEEENKD